MILTLGLGSGASPRKSVESLAANRTQTFPVEGDKLGFLGQPPLWGGLALAGNGRFLSLLSHMVVFGIIMVFK